MNVEGDEDIINLCALVFFFFFPVANISSNIFKLGFRQCNLHNSLIMTDTDYTNSFIYLFISNWES